MKEIFTGVYREKGKLYTINEVQGEDVYGEDLVERNGVEYRRWDNTRSKPAAAIMNGLKIFPIERSSEILYLGAASGTTVSHFSDILGENGFVHAIEFSPKVISGLLNLSRGRGNIAPLLIDARRLEETNRFLTDVDVIYQDISQRDQSEILIRNSKHFLKEGGHAMVAIKSQSISSSISKERIFEREIEKLSEYFEVLSRVNLEPHQKDHMFLVLKKR